MAPLVGIDVMIVGMNDYPAAQRKASSESGHVQKTIFIQLRRKAEIKEKDIEIISIQRHI